MEGLGLGGREVRPLGRVVILVLLRSRQRMVWVYTVIWVLDFLILHSILNTSESAYIVCKHALSLLAFVSKNELSEFQEEMWWHLSQEIQTRHIIEFEPTHLYLVRKNLSPCADCC